MCFHALEANTDVRYVPRHVDSWDAIVPPSHRPRQPWARGALDGDASKLGLLWSYWSGDLVDQAFTRERSSLARLPRLTVERVAAVVESPVTGQAESQYSVTAEALKSEHVRVSVAV